MVLVGAGCTDDKAADPIPVTSATSTTAPPATTAPTIASSTIPAPDSTTTTAAAPPSTKPLTTAPPSPLLTEVTAAYDAAYADLLAAEMALDENSPALPNHIAGAQLEQWRAVIRDARAAGLTARSHPGSSPWRRVEAMVVEQDVVRLDVCRYDNTETIDRMGTVANPATRPFRYVETLRNVEGVWKWVGREWVDQSSEQSDCASP